MSIPRRLMVLALVIVPMVGASWTSLLSNRSGASTAVSLDPQLTFVGDPTRAEIELVEWAVGRFGEAGLHLPALEIRFLDRCLGKAGLYYVGQQRLDLCRPNPVLVLHELAHAWDDTGAADRDAMLDRWGLDAWYIEEQDNSGHKHSHRVERPGGEWLAMIVAWGLMDVDTSTSQTAPRSHVGFPASRMCPCPSWLRRSRC